MPLTANGVADTATWAKLETAGAASQGHVQIDWTEEVEGVKNVGGRASFDWKLAKTALDITVGITFVKVHSGVDGAITSGWPTSSRSGAPSRRSTCPIPRSTRST